MAWTYVPLRVVLLVPCTWCLTIPLLVGYALAHSARRRAHTLFPPRAIRRIQDPQVIRIQTWRTWTATALALLLLAVYGTADDLADAEHQFAVRLFVTPVLLLLSAPVVIGLLFRWATPPTRARMGPPLRVAGRSALWYIGAVMGVPLLVTLLFWVSDSSEGSGRSEVPAWIPQLIVLPLLWLLFFVVFATGSAIRSGFNTADVHAVLPALLTVLLVWEFAVLGFMTGGGLPPGPPVVQYLTVLGGPASVTALAWWELRRLRERHGVTLRNDPAGR
ncbi:hypothetical protein ACIPSE_34255 [Streptomyces sp. NPDC090106]|uniref:hypothetical protein n=1 Tax=Streptomyces sp. NPDC090106 TaxID=3365946 RepID=UPI00382C601C